MKGMGGREGVERNGWERGRGGLKYPRNRLVERIR